MCFLFFSLLEVITPVGLKPRADVWGLMADIGGKRNFKAKGHSQ